MSVSSLPDIPTRGRFQGAWQILQYNWPMYVGGLLAGAVATVALRLLPLQPLLLVAGRLGLALALFWLVASIIASWYVYDVSPLCRWTWVGSAFSEAPRIWANLHAGLDESTPSLMALFPRSEVHVFDFFDDATMTEPSIRRARRMTPPPILPQPVAATDLPLSCGALDAAFLFFAAHEIRRPDERLRLFREVRRVLRPGGRVVLAEHLRDTANFVVFGPGFFHFLPRAEWLRLAREVGLTVVQERAITPFTRVLVLEKPVAL